MEINVQSGNKVFLPLDCEVPSFASLKNDHTVCFRICLLSKQIEEGYNRLLAETFSYTRDVEAILRWVYNSLDTVDDCFKGILLKDKKKYQVVEGISEPEFNYYDRLYQIERYSQPHPLLFLQQSITICKKQVCEFISRDNNFKQLVSVVNGINLIFKNLTKIFQSEKADKQKVVFVDQHQMRLKMLPRELDLKIWPIAHSYSALLLIFSAAELKKAVQARDSEYLKNATECLLSSMSSILLAPCVPFVLYWNFMQPIIFGITINGGYVASQSRHFAKWRYYFDETIGFYTDNFPIEKREKVSLSNLLKAYCSSIEVYQPVRDEADIRIFDLSLSIRSSIYKL